MIIFTEDINDDKLRMAYNNDVVRFYDNSGIAPLYCDITIGSTGVRIYPGPAGQFFFNFKSYITSLINTRNFVDTLVPDIESTWVYNADDGSYLSLDVEFEIKLIDNTLVSSTYNLQWISGAEQYGGFVGYRKHDQYILSPFNKFSANDYYIKYWEGYPFDISLYIPNGSVYMVNQTLMQTAHFNTIGHVNRIVFSDGRSDVSIEDIWPIADGYNKVRVQAAETESDKDRFLTIEKIPYKCGVYIKFLNKYGVYSYWLFENTYSVEGSSRYREDAFSGFNNINEDYSSITQTGKEGQRTFRVTSDLLREEEVLILQDIIDSPKIYLFTGAPLSRNGQYDWIEVILKTGNIRIKNPRQELVPFNLEFELPQRETQNL